MDDFLEQHLDGEQPRPFTRGAAVRAGVADHELERLVDEGRLRRPVYGTYAATALPDDVATRAAALRLVVPPGAFLCDETAAYLHGADGAAEAANDDLAPHVVRCFRPPDDGRVRRDGVRGGERALAPEDLELVDGLAVTTAPRTALDLGRLRSRGRALAAMDSLAAAGGFAAADLVREVPRFRGERGVVQLRELAPLVDPGAQSPPESILRLAWHDAGLPAPETQVEVLLEGVPRRIDVGTRRTRFGAEYDGLEFHADPEQVRDDLARRRLFEERRWHIEVFGRADIFGPGADPTGRLVRAYDDHLHRVRPGTRSA